MARGRLHGIARYALELARHLPRLAPDLDLNVQSPQYTPDGSAILFLLEDDQAVGLAKIPAAGGPVERLVNGRQVIAGYSAAKTGDTATASQAEAELKKTRERLEAEGKSYDAKSIAWRNGWQNQEIADMGKAAALEQDPAKRAELYKALSVKVQNEGPYAMLYQPTRTYGVRKDVSGFQYAPASTPSIWFSLISKS